jgi:hypothetical protein
MTLYRSTVEGGGAKPALFNYMPPITRNPSEGIAGRFGR